MADIYVGAIVLTFNGADYEIVSLDDTLRTGRAVVKTMNRKGKALGTAAGIADYELRVTVAIPKTGEPNWQALLDAKVTIEPQDGGGKRQTWTGVSLSEIGSKYSTDGEATRDLTLFALDYYEE